ncbi:MAG: hypothetical protein IJ160_04140 [Muribaculaceae bacterium]|nr:hypothetical protein [Muribaculaceae bacterium]
MKKFLLFAAAFAALSMSAQDYTFEKVWEVNSGLPANADARQGICINGTYYINVKTNNAETGVTPYVVAVTENGVETTNFAGGANCGITRDEAGNLVISLAAFPGSWVCDGDTPMIRVIDPETGDAVEYGIPEDAAVLGRSDMLGMAQGDLFNDGKLFMCGCTNGEPEKTNSGVCILNIVGGEVDFDNSYEAMADVTLSASTATVINNIDGERIFYVTRNATPYILTPNGEGFVGEAVSLPNKGASCGAQIFQFDGKDIAVYPILPNYQDGFAVAEVGAEEPLFTVEPTGKTAYAQCNWVNAEVIGNDAYIYQYMPGLFVACYKLSAPMTAVSNVNAAKTATGVKYVNVAGQVSNVPFQGVNMVVTSYSDGTQNTTKVVK